MLKKVKYLSKQPKAFLQWNNENTVRTALDHLCEYALILHVLGLYPRFEVLTFKQARPYDMAVLLYNFLMNKGKGG